MSKLLLDEHPLLLMPTLACKIGLNESIILQQVHYWNEINKKTETNFYDGYHWTYNSYEKWSEQFPFFGLSTIKRAFSRLEKLNLLVSANYNKLKIDRTKWYRVNYEELNKYEDDPSIVSNWTKQDISLNKPLPETNAETNTKTKDLSIKTSTSHEVDALSSSEIKLRNNIFHFFTDRYEEYYETSHPFYKKELKDSCFDYIMEYISTEEDAYEMINEFFYNVSDESSDGYSRTKNFALFCDPAFFDILMERMK